MASTATPARTISPDDPDCTECLTGTRLILAAIALALANFVVVLDTTVANVSIPHIAGGLAVSPTQGTWAITSYAVADAITVPLTGWLAGRFGAVRWFTFSLIGFGLFSILCGLSQSLEALVFFRVLQGLSGGPLMPLSQTLLRRIFPKERAPQALAIWAITTTSAPIVGPIMGGWISDNWSWPWIFFINLPIVILCFFSVRSLVSRYELPTVRLPIDTVGLMLLVLTVGAFQIMLDTGKDHDWFSSAWIIGLGVTAAIGLALFIVWELTAEHPIVDIRVFRSRGFAVATAAISLGFGGYFASIVLMPLWLQQMVGYTATQSGMTVAWAGVLAVAFSPLAARLVPRVDIRLMVSGGILWMALASLLRSGWTTGSGYWTFALPQLLQGAGMPFFFIGLTTLAMGSVAEKDQISAAGLMSFLRTLFGAIGTAVATTEWESAGRVARSEIVGHMANDQSMLDRLVAAGLSLEQARASIDRLVEVQASTVAVTNIFIASALVFAFAAAIVWLAPRLRRVTTAAAGH